MHEAMLMLREDVEAWNEKKAVRLGNVVVMCLRRRDPKYTSTSRLKILKYIAVNSGYRVLTICRIRSVKPGLNENDLLPYLCFSCMRYQTTLSESAHNGNDFVSYISH